MKKISITDGIGTGLTKLSAFDDALFKAGIGNHNLINLSSVIPINHTVEISKVDLNSTNQGDRLYVVLANERTDKLGKTVAAGLGWVETVSSEKWGLFVEHEGNSEEEVQEAIKNSLTSMMECRANETWGDIKSHVVSVTCTDKPVCALVAAIYKQEEW